MQGSYWVPLFHPSSQLLLQPKLPPLKLTLEHQALSSFECALRLPPDFSSLYALATRNVPCRLKKKPSWRSFCSSATQPLPSPHETLIMCPLSPYGLQPTLLFPPSFPTAQAIEQPDSSLLQADYPPFPLLISKYGLTDLYPSFLVPHMQKLDSRSKIRDFAYFANSVLFAKKYILQMFFQS